ncbi:dolichol kinase [Thermogladius sp. 4427co]|uniref:dolichol kinase n=1 Tax=Thermogladius sp. 4427co TaxID=3450718 RepID=UPI003F7A94CC
MPGQMFSVLIPKNLPLELAYAFLLLLLVLSSLIITRRTYRLMKEKGMRDNVAVYYNRKIVHMLAGGVTALLVPILFTSPLIPFVFAIALAVLLYIPHKRGLLLEWFQTSENMYEVNFCLGWGFSLLLIWVLTGSSYYAVIPPLFISFGDAVTGIIRNLMYKRRTKSWFGNIGMLAVTTIIGYVYGGLLGVVSGIVASIIEHFEVYPYLDDNILISLASALVILIGWIAF